MLVVTAAERADAPAIAALMEELDRFYGATEVDPLSQRVAEIEAMLFGATPAASVLLARDEGQVIGLASYSFLWPAAGLTRSLFLKELYVRQDRQHQGIGTALMRAICEVAAKKGCSRVEWTTENTNPAAMAFYAQLGAPLNPDKVFYRLEANGIAHVAAV